MYSSRGHRTRKLIDIYNAVRLLFANLTIMAIQQTLIIFKKEIHPKLRTEFPSSVCSYSVSNVLPSPFLDTLHRLPPSGLVQELQEKPRFVIVAYKIERGYLMMITCKSPANRTQRNRSTKARSYLGLASTTSDLSVLIS